jgi:hypothetical protein
LLLHFSRIPASSIYKFRNLINIGKIQERPLIKYHKLIFALMEGVLMANEAKKEKF